MEIFAFMERLWDYQILFIYSLSTLAQSWQCLRIINSPLQVRVLILTRWLN